MAVLRFLAIALPQVLILLFVLGARDMLGGWNQTDEAFTTLVLLFMIVPPLTLAYAVAEALRYWRSKKSHDNGTSMLWAGLAIMLFLESLAIDLYLLTQVRMH